MQNTGTLKVKQLNGVQPLSVLLDVPLFASFLKKTFLQPIYFVILVPWTDPQY